MPTENLLFVPAAEMRANSDTRRDRKRNKTDAGFRARNGRPG
jgi:hypothetical protein